MGRGNKERERREEGESEGEGKGEGGGRLTHWHFDEGEGEGGAEESIDDHGNSLSYVHLQVFVITSTGLTHLCTCVHVTVT